MAKQILTNFKTGSHEFSNYGFKLIEILHKQRTFEMKIISAVKWLFHWKRG